jgi:ABC-type nitrate/sulfonate/bicarbonate transport system substrate-binding protein
VAVDIINPRSYGVDFPGDNLYTSEGELHQHPGRAARFLRASLKGWTYAMAHEAEVIELIRRDYAPTLDAELLAFEAKAISRMIEPELTPLGEVNPARYQVIADTYRLLGLAKENQVPNSFFYNQRNLVALTAISRHGWRRIPGFALASWMPGRRWTSWMNAAAPGALAWIMSPR